MNFLLNVLFGALGGYIVYYVLKRLRSPEEIAVIIGVIVAIVVFFANFAVQVRS